MHYVIIGNSATGIGAAESIRATDSDAQITIIGDEVQHVYSRPLISHYIAGEVAAGEMGYRPSDFYTRLEIDTRLGVRADAIDVNAHAVTLADGQSLPYDKLLIATGSIQKFPPIQGREHTGVFDFWTKAHADAIRDRISGWDVQSPRSGVVIGGGLVGIQAASGLRGAGLEVVLVELLPSILSRILDAPAASYAQKIFEQHGVRVLTGRSVKEIVGTGQDGVTGVVLDNGERVECGLVVKATGVVPNLALVKGTPISTNRGIVVNEYFQTNIPDVCAAGDVAETYDITRGKIFVNANWPNAHAQGRIAGLNMAGRATRYNGSIGMTSMPLFGVPIVSLGIVEPEKGDDVRVRETPCIYQKLVLRGDHLIGAVMVGDTTSVGLINHWVQTQKPAKLIKDVLLDGKAQFYFARREQVRKEMEGVGLPWRKSLSSTERYEKHFDDVKWEERERDERQ
ncbi:MAG: FAD-dependent oxidoreductase [Chloroflexi bacterium]|nr:FAD-dependent oxidoreductase [Chloroflexota bacterium]